MRHYHAPMEPPAHPSYSATDTSLLKIPGAPLFLGVAFAGMLAWLALTLVYADIGSVLRLPRTEALWGWVGLSLLQVGVGRAGESKAWRAVLLGVLAAGVATCLVRNLLAESTGEGPVFALEMEAASLSIAALLTVGRGLGFLSGRGIRVADLWLFAGLQWLLVWAAAFAALALRQPAGGWIAARQTLAELSILGVGAHAAVVLGLRHLPVVLAAPLRERAALLALIAYDGGLVATVLGWPWLGCPLMFGGALFLLLAAAGLLRGNARGLAALALLSCVYLMIAASLRPFDNAAFAGWRHAAAGGVVGLALSLTAAISTRVDVPRRFQARGAVALGISLFAVGVAARLGVEIYETIDPTMHRAAALGSVLEIAGALALVATALRASAARRKNSLSKETP